jgi:hypothetical protein
VSPIFLAHIFTHIFLRCALSSFTAFLSGWWVVVAGGVGEGTSHDSNVCGRRYVRVGTACRPKFETIETMVQLPKAINLMQLLIETDPELLFPVRCLPTRPLSPLFCAH